MGRKKFNTPVRSTPRVRHAHETPPHITSTSPSSSLSLNDAQEAQEPVENEVTTGNTPAWASALWLQQSDIHRESTRRNMSASQQALQPETYRHGPPATIMTSIDGVSMRSNGASAHPLVVSPRNATESQYARSQNPTPPIGKIVLPKPERTLLHRETTSASWSPAVSRTIAQSDQRRSRTGSIPPVPQPFDPAKCHWSALRDVAFVLDGCVNVPREDLCQLLRFRYARTDPQMARVEVCHIQPMYDFCKGKHMYERVSKDFIKPHMVGDLKLMREGGDGLVNEDL